MKTLEEVKQIFSEKGYCLLEDKYNGNKQYMTFSKNGYLYYNTLNGFIKTDNPKKWGINNPYSIINLRHYVSEINQTVIIPNQEYNSSKLHLICSCGNHYYIKWDNFLKTNQCQCPKCGRAKSAQNHIKDEYYKLMELKQLFPLNEYHGCKHSDYYRTKEGYIVKTSLYNIKNGANEYTTLFHICNKYSIDNMHLYLKLNSPELKLLSTEYIGANKYYRFRCECGREFFALWYNVMSGKKVRCEYCTHFASTLAIKTEEWLNQNKIDFTKEKTFEDCKRFARLRFDYYLPKLNKIIETDGNQHDHPVRFGNMSQEEAILAFIETKERDKIKDNYCKNHNIPLLRIKQKEFESDKYKIKLQTFIS